MVDGGVDGGPARALTPRQQAILDCIAEHVERKGYPPSVREIGDEVGLGSPSTVHAHLETLRAARLRPSGSDQAEGHRDPARPRDGRRRAPAGPPGAAGGRRRRRLNVLAAEQVEELVPIPADFTGDGELFMLRVRGDSMVDAAIVDGDFVVARSQSFADNGDIVVAGIPDGEATVKQFQRRDGLIRLLPANPRLEPMIFDPADVTIYGKVVTVLRRL